MKHLTHILTTLLALALLASCSAPPNGRESLQSNDPDALASHRTEPMPSSPVPSAAADVAPSPVPTPPEGTASDEAGASTSATPNAPTGAPSSDDPPNVGSPDSTAPTPNPDEPNYSLDTTGRYSNLAAKYDMPYFTFVADETMYWFYENVIGPNSCTDGCLYVKDMTTGHIRLAYPDPVGDPHWIDGDMVFAVTADGSDIIQVSESLAHEPFTLLENAGTDISDIVTENGYLYYCDADGAHRFSIASPAKETLVSADDVAHFLACDGLLLTYHSGTPGVHTYDDETVTLRLTNISTGFSREIPYHWENRATSRGSKIDPPPPHTTETADALGITLADYPTLDGSASAYPILESIYWEMFRVDSTHFDKNYPSTPSGTETAYARLISGDADLIFAPHPSDDILRAANKAAAPIELTELATTPDGEIICAAILVDLPSDHPARVLYNWLLTTPEVVAYTGFTPYPHTAEELHAVVDHTFLPWYTEGMTDYSADPTGFYFNTPTWTTYYTFLYDASGIDWAQENYVGPTTCADGYLYTKHTPSGFIRLTYPEPVDFIYWIDGGDTGELLAVTGGTTVVRICEAHTYAPYTVLENTSAISSLDLFGDRLYYADKTAVYRLNLTTGETELILDESNVRHISVIDDTRLIWADGNYDRRLCDLTTGESTAPLPDHEIDALLA